MKPTDRKLLRLIALFKLAKAILLIAVGVSALKLIHQDVARVIEHWVAILGIDPGKQYVAKALQKAADLTPNKIRGLELSASFMPACFSPRAPVSGWKNAGPSGSPQYSQLRWSRSRSTR